MSKSLTESRKSEINRFNAEQRLNYLLKEVIKHGELWVLTDEHGCMMLNIGDDDGIPVWPNKEFAESWATGEWQDCKPLSISLSKWHKDWSIGMEQDELSVVVFPNEHEEGLVLYPDEFDHELKQTAKKLH